MTFARVSKALQSSELVKLEESPLAIKTPNNSPDPSPREDDTQSVPLLPKNSPRLALSPRDEVKISPRAQELKMSTKLDSLALEKEGCAITTDDEKKLITVRKKSSGSFGQFVRKSSSTFVTSAAESLKPTKKY